MSMFLRMFLLIAGTVLTVSQARAESVPADTATFVSYCADNFEACRNRLLNIDNLMRLGGSNRKCSFPRTTSSNGGSTLHTDSIAATTAVVAWLKANGASRAPMTDDAIEQAKRGLWPNLCRQ